MVKGFSIIREENLDYFVGKGTLVQHDRTGLKIFYFKPEKNNENYFCYTFKTPVEDDSGIAHALEHMILQGSQKYPVKNLFSQLEQKSLSNGYNACTRKFSTHYYAESYIPEDYYRLLEVYGDSVFFPLLDENSFKQEVWRLDLNENKEPFINGVVYNEMSSIEKIGTYSLEKEFYKQLHKDSEMGYISGGDFLEIPGLTRDKLKSFHEKYYTPANCLLLLFGKLDLDEQLEFLESHLLNRLPSDTKEVQIKDEITFLPSMTELNINIPYVGIDDFAVDLSICCKDTTEEENKIRDFFFSRLSTLMNKQHQFCELGDFDCGKLGSPHHKFFGMTLYGVKKEKVEAAKEFLLNALKDSLKDGMDFEDIKTVCESTLRGFENAATRTVYGSLENYVNIGWVEGNDVFRDIFDVKGDWLKLYEEIRSYKDEDYRNMLDKYLLSNPNTLFVVRTPDKNYYEEIEKKRETVLQSLLKSTSVEEIGKDKEAFEEFLKKDDTETINKLFPPLNIKDIKDYEDAGLADIEEIPGKYGPVLLFSSAQDVNKSVAITIKYPIDSLSLDEMKRVSWIPLFIENFGFDGIKLAASEPIMAEAELYAGSGAVNFIGSNCGGAEIYENRYWMNYSFLCYDEKFEEALKLIKKIIYCKNFDDENERQNAKDYISEVLHTYSPDEAINYAGRYTGSFFENVDKLENDMLGIGSLEEQKKDSESDIDELMNTWQQIYEKIINGSGIIEVICSEENKERVKDSLKAFIKETEIKPLEKSLFPDPMQDLPETGKKVATILTPVSSGAVTMQFRSSLYPSKECAVEIALMNWFNENILQEEVRKYHGSYGYSSFLNSQVNRIFINTRQDPNPKISLQIIEDSLEQLNHLENREEITEDYVKQIAMKTYVAAMGDMDPTEKGCCAMNRRYTGQKPENRHDRIKYTLGLTKEDFIAAGKRVYEMSRNYKACIVTSDENQICGEVLGDMRKYVKE